MTFPVIFVSACFFFLGEPIYLVIGAFVYEFNFMLDCVDGKLARLTGKCSKLGEFFDLYLDNINVFVNLLALVLGQYRLTGEVKFITVGLIYLFIHTTQLLNKYIALNILGSDYKKDFYSKEIVEKRGGRLGRIKSILAKNKLNVVLFSTVEGEALVFFVGPISGYIFESIVLSSVLVSIFFALKTIFFFRTLREVDRSADRRN